MNDERMKAMREASRKVKRDVLHRIRDVRHYDGRTIIVKLSRKSAIQRFCLECMGGVKSDIKDCTDKLCPLYPFRMGRIDRKIDRQLRKKVDKGEVRVAHSPRKKTSKTQGKTRNKRTKAQFFDWA